MPDTELPLTDFASLLAAARRQDEPQRLLFVFAQKELPDQPTAQQRRRFESGQGGSLRPCLCVDKAPEDLTSFAALAAESAATGLAWDVVFISSLAGRGGIAPNPDQADQPLHFMVQAINDGRVDEFIAFDRSGNTLKFI